MSQSDTRNDDENESSPELPVSHRSTFEPPAGAAPRAGEDVAGADDDALAAALAEELGRVTRTGSIPVQPPAAELPVEPAFEPPVAPGVEPPVESPVEPAPVWSLDDVPVDQSPVAPSPADPSPVAPPPGAESPVEQPPVVSSGVPLTPPVRQSLPDDALVTWIGDGATLEAMEQLEREMSLRQQDAQAFSEWEQSMVALGTPEALEALGRARPGFSDVLDPATGAIPTSPPAPQSVEPGQLPAEPLVTEQPEFEQRPPEQPVFEQPTPVEGSAFPPATMPEDEAWTPPTDTVPATEPDPVGVDQGDLSALNEAQLADLALAPAPSSLPYSDIPPPPGELEAHDWHGAPQDAAAGVAAGIPELIEPHGPLAGAPGAVPMSSDFDQFIAEAGLAEAVVDTHDDAPDAAQPDTGGVFPLAVYDPDEVVPDTIDLVSPRAFRVELAGVEPSPIEQRVGRSARLFWIWFAANSSVISVGLGAVVFSLGVSLRQAIIATLVGVSISSLPLGIGALAGKRSGQPTMVVSRATFGVLGNILPAVLAFLTRVFWGAVLVWLFALGLSAVNDATGLLDLDDASLSYVGLGAAVLLAGVIAYFGYGLIARVQAVLTIVSSVLVVGFVMLSWPAVDLRAAMRVADGDWMLVATGAVLVFSVLGLVWAMSSADVARYQNPHSSGAGSMLWSWAGAALPAFLLVGYGSLLAASDPELLTGLLEQPLETLTLLVPAVYVYPMLAVLGLGLLSGAVMTIYSGGFALQAVGLRAPRSIVVIVVAVLTGAAAAGILVAVSGFDELIRDLATTLAVPVAAWVGVFAGELMMRSRRYHAPSLVRRGGVYADVRWVNLATLVVASVVGFAFTDAAVSWLSWQGFGWGLIGFAPDSVIAGTDLGVVGALVLALLVTVAVGKPGINVQERAEATESAQTKPVAADPELD